MSEDQENLELSGEINEDPFGVQVEDFFTLMQEFTEGQRAFNARILIDLDTIKKGMVILIKQTKKEAHFKHVEKTDLSDAPKPEIKKAYPGIPIKDMQEVKNKVEEYQKKDGSTGYKLTKDAIFEDKFYKYVQKCKYGCDNWISFDNYAKGQKALHIDGVTLEVIGRYCPKYE